YTTGLLYTNWSISPWIGMWVGVALSLAASLAIGLPSLRLRGHYFILITIAFAEILRYTALTWESLTGGGGGFSYAPTSWNNFTAFQFNIDKTPYYYIIFAMLLLNLYLVYKLKDSKWGYYFVAIREDEELATASGINVTKYKLLATALSAALTSIGGSFYMQFVLYIDPQMVLSLELMTKMMLPAALGGMGTVIGPVIGSFILIPLGEYIRVYFSQIQALHLIVYGLILGIVSISMPGGIIGRLSKTGISSRLSSRRLKKL
nr:branched-chain amino acid ABC transporter permease [Nitrososphaeria archaeon]NIQ32906.1 branched-chain amino acid ABC transporter permease [Nitrososphaeria archaeon]